MNAQEPTRTLLEISDLSYRYPSREDFVLQDFNLTIASGSITAILGRSGTGKTTLLNIIAGYLTPTLGTCKFDENRIVGPDSRRIPIFQDDSLWPWWTAVENVLLASRLRNDSQEAHTDALKANSLLRRVGLPSKADDQFPKQLSLGMRKRVEIARALMAEPILLIADEPFSSVDTQTRESLHDLIRGIWQEKQLTVLFATHDLHEALYLASEIVVLQPSSPKTITNTLSNPFQGNRMAVRTCSREYFQIYDELKSVLKASQV